MTEQSFGLRDDQQLTLVGPKAATANWLPGPFLLPSYVY
jgi:hypothetical protein